MRFSDSFLEEVRQRLPISQVVGEYVQWDKRKSQPGKGDYWACCPFHGEKTPSFHADDRRGIYHCFGCGVTGDHFRFLTEQGNMSFPEAVEKVANLAGVPLPARDEKAEQRDRARKTLFDVMDMAADYFVAALNHNIGAAARGYLLERGVSASEQVEFRIGFAPASRNGLKEHLAAQGVTAEQMAATGLVVTGEDIAVPYDRFRDRVMFPITDMRGRVIAFGGRAMSPDVPAKYLNSPETELFKKRMTLYNGQAARKHAQAGQPLVVVEGYMDVVAVARAGFGAAVAPLGTALTQEHLNLLWRMVDMPVLCFDGDDAGQRAMARTLEIALPILQPGKSLKVATLPKGLDPDDLIAQSGAAAFGELIENARPLSQILFSIETGKGLPTTPEERAALEQRIRAKVNMINDPSVKRHYAQAVEEGLQDLFRSSSGGRDGGGGYGQRGFGQRGGGYARNSRSGGARGGQFRAGGLTPKRVVSDSLRNSALMQNAAPTNISAREAVIVMTLVNHPRLAESRLEMLAGLDFDAPMMRQLTGAILEAVATLTLQPEETLIPTLTVQGFAPEIEGLKQILTRYGIWQSGQETNEVDAETGLNHALALHYKSVQLNRELRAAELALGQDPSEESFERLKDIQNQIASVDGTEALIEGFGTLSGRASPNL